MIDVCVNIRKCHIQFEVIYLTYNIIQNRFSTYLITQITQNLFENKIPKKKTKCLIEIII